MIIFFDNFVDSLRIGAIYSLVALSFVLSSKVYGQLNFITSEIFMLFIYIFVVFSRIKRSLILNLLISTLICCVVDFLFYKYIYKKIFKFKENKKNSLIINLSIAYLFQEVLVFLFGNKPINTVNIFSGYKDFFGIRIENSISALLIISFLIILAIYFLIKDTKLGRVYRAISENSDAVELLGINIEKTIIIIYLLSGFLASCAGFLFSSSFKIIEPYSGISIGIRSYIASIVSGGKSIIKIVISCLCISILEIFFKTYISNSFADIFVFSLLSLYLLIDKNFLKAGKNC
jgi:branched-chain amino acid transport system permease protein